MRIISVILLAVGALVLAIVATIYVSDHQLDGNMLVAGLAISFGSVFGLSSVRRK